MQKIKLLNKLFFFLLFTLSIKTVTAQTGLNFQGVARSSTNVVLASQDITIRLTILQGSTTGTSEYSETRKVATNAQGLFTAVIGDMGALSTVGNFATINWKLTPKFLKIEMDPAAGTNFITMGTTQFQYVAYAQFAKSVDAENVVGVLTISSGGTGVNNLSALKTALTIDKINNTADADKPLSTATQTALGLKANTSDVINSLANKVDKVSGKDLSTNDYTTIEKNKLSAITGTNTGDQDLSIYATSTSVALKVNTADLTASLANKVDKISGKGLSTNDYTTIEKTKLADITGTNTGDQDLSLLATIASVSLKENQSNKSTDALLGGINANDILFPTQKAVKAYVAANTASGGIADFGIVNIKLADLAVTDAKIADVASSKITGTLGVAHGGTGATTASAARTNLGLVIGTNVQAPLVAGTDYLVPTGSAASLTNFPTFNQNTTGNATTATLAGNITATTNTTLTTLSSLTSVGTLANLTVTNPIAGSITGNAGTATTATSATTATNLAAGLGGQLPYQSAAGTTTMLANGSAGQVLQSNGTTSAPSWVAAATGDMVLASVQTVTGAKIFGAAGAVGKLIIAGTTSGTTILDATAAAGSGTVTLPTTGTLATLAGTETLTNKTLTSATLTTPALGTPASGVMTNVTGTAAGLTAGTATNLAAGLGGQLPYQSAAGTTTMLANGTAGQILQSNGTTSAPSWISGLLSKVEGTSFTGSLLVGHTTTGTLTTAEYNTGIGLGALQAVTTGDYNTANGYAALGNNTSGFRNTANGVAALGNNTSGGRNTAFGYYALYSNNTGNDGVAIGVESQYYVNSTATPYNNTNTSVGYQSLRGSSTAANNTGLYNTAIGYNVLMKNSTGYSNTATGYNALVENTTGYGNTAIGSYALATNLTGINNTAIGYNAGRQQYGTGNNTFIGYYAGYNNTTGTNNTIIGSGAEGSSATAINEITIGNGSIATLRAQVQSITALSDRRDKTDITRISEGLDFIKQLKPVSFTWNTRDKSKVGIKSAGFIAQDLLALQQKSAIGANLDLVSQENPDKLEARYSNLLPVIVKAIQEESAQKDSEIAALKAFNQEQQKINQAQQKQIEELKLLILSMKK